MEEEGKGQSRLGLARVRVQGWVGWQVHAGPQGPGGGRVGPGTRAPQPLLCCSWCPYSTDENT